MSSSARRRDSATRAPENNHDEFIFSQAGRTMTEIEVWLRGKSKEAIEFSETLRLFQKTRGLLRYLMQPESDLRVDMREIKEKLTNIEKNTSKTTETIKSYAAAATANN